MGRAKIFQIGYRKCGTTALWSFFNRSGIPAVHWDDGNLARRMRENIRMGRRVLDGYDEEFEAFTDMEFNVGNDYFEGFKCYGQILHDYPDAKFIFNTRNEERWLLSMRRWARRHHHMDYVMFRYGSRSLRKFTNHMRVARSDHYRQVIATIPPERLLVFDIEADSPEKLCDFCDLPLSCAANLTKTFVTPSTPVYLTNQLLRRLPNPVARRLRKLAKK